MEIIIFAIGLYLGHKYAKSDKKLKMSFLLEDEYQRGVSNGILKEKFRRGR